jgi:dCTP deaminase
MSVLTKQVIIEEPQAGRTGDGLVLTPLKEDQIGSSSVDMHLGHEFVVFRRASMTSLDIKDSEQPLSRNVHRYQEKIRISKQDEFVLHPGQLVLGSTREYIALPTNIAATITARSTWGRTGLIIATATKIDPGFKGCVTLELMNGGVIPLVLYPGLRLAQLVLFRTEGKSTYDGSYKFPTGPQFPELDRELGSITGV